jgi:DNA-binding IclR family transcriptional regulator
MVKSATRTLDILEAVSSAANGLNHTEIAKALRIPKSSLTGLLRNLAVRRYLNLDPVSGLFTVGPAVLTLSRAFLGRLELIKTVAPIVAELRNATDEATILAILDGSEIVVLHQEASSQTLSAIMRVGDRAPALLTAAGKALVAFRSQADIDSYLADVPEQPAAPVRLSAEMLRQQLFEIKEGAIAISREEFVHGTVAVGLPVFGPEAEVPMAAITVNMPSVRFNDRKLAIVERQLRDAVREASSRLGAVAQQAGVEKV